jgi:hypothetical protein
MIEHAQSSRLLSCITFRFRADRLVFLAETLRTLAEYPVASMDVVILTNYATEAGVGLIDQLAREIFPTNSTQVRTFDRFDDPYELAWCHKPIIAHEFLEGIQPRYTHFIYLEEDIGLTFTNYCYFLLFRERLRDFGLLPAFVRMDYSVAQSGFVATDSFWPVYVPLQAHVIVDEFAMVNMPNPYNPIFILDRELGEEYVQSRSFAKDTSYELCHWATADRSAMGLCLENVPTPFQTRYVVPVSVLTNTVPAAARVRHFPNNYADNPRSALGKVRMNNLFAGASNLKKGDWWPTQANCHNSDGKPERFFLVTSHDTIIYLDLAAKRLCHNPFGIAPLNLYLEITGSRARLVGYDPVSSADIPLSITRDSGEISELSEPASADLDVQHLSDGSIGIKRNDFYLAADLDGLVRNNRTWCRLFEQFRLVRTDTIDGLAILQRHSWISDRDGQVVTLKPQPINFGRVPPHESSALAATLAPGAMDSRRDIVFGPAHIRLDGRTRKFEFNRENEGDPNSPLKVFITDLTGEKHCFSQLPHRAA